MSQFLSDISQSFGDDLDETPDGDIAIATGEMLTIQRVIRRFLTVTTSPTNSPYPWQPTYGGSLPERIGLTINVLDLTGVLLSQMRQEASVAQSPAPTVKIDTSLAGQNVYPIGVKYYDLSGSPVNFNFNYVP